MTFVTGIWMYAHVDGILMDFEENFIDLWLFCLAAILSGIGVIFAICCIVFDLALHKKQ